MLRFQKQPHETNDFLEPPVFVSSPVDELSDEQNSLATLEADEKKKFFKSPGYLLGDLAPINAFQQISFPQLTVVTLPQIKNNLLFPKKFFSVQLSTHLQHFR